MGTMCPKLYHTEVTSYSRQMSKIEGLQTWFLKSKVLVKLDFLSFEVLFYQVLISDIVLT